MARRFRFVVLLALLVASVTGLAACGGGDNSSDADPNALLKQTFGPNQSIKSGKLAIALGFNGQGLKNVNGPVALKLTGPFESNGKGNVPDLDLDLSLGGGGTGFSAGVTTTDGKAWLRLQGTDFLVDDATYQRFKQGYEQSAAKSTGQTGPSFASLGIEPLKWLTNPKVVGTEQMGGAETYHITAGVDVGAFLDDLSTVLSKAGSLGQAAAGVPSKLTAAQRQAIEASVRNAALDIWTGKDDKALRRLKLAVDIRVPQALRSRAGGLSTGKLLFDLGISDLNRSQDIAAPKNARPLSDLQQLIAGGAAGAGSPAPTTTAPSPGSGSGGTGSSQYLDCVAAAGSNVAKIQKCATLAGQ